MKRRRISLKTSIEGDEKLPVYLRSISLGAFEYINKPIKIEEFERIVQNALDRNNRRNNPGKDGHDQYSFHR